MKALFVWQRSWPTAACVLVSMVIGLCVTVGAHGQSAQSAGGAPIKIGVLTALSGPYVPFGQPLADGVKIAVDEVNSEGGLLVGGIRHPVQTVVRDTRSDVNATVAAVSGLVRDDGVARALMTAPCVVLVDEVTEGLQPSVVDRLAAVLRRAAVQDGQAILLVEQHVRFALEVADRYAVLKLGAIVASGSTRDADASDTIEALLRV